MPKASLPMSSKYQTNADKLTNHQRIDTVATFQSATKVKPTQTGSSQPIESGSAEVRRSQPPLIRKKVRRPDSLDRLEEATWWREFKRAYSEVESMGSADEERNALESFYGGSNPFLDKRESIQFTDGLRSVHETELRDSLS